MWRGDYYNLGAGDEIGIYRDPISVELIPQDLPVLNKLYSTLIDWQEYIKETVIKGLPDSTVAKEFKFEFWSVVPFELPMTLSLYDYHGEQSIDNLFIWRPEIKQWWITGFNGNINHPVAERLVVIGSIDFSDRPDLYQALKNDTSNDRDHSKYMFFDDGERKAWVIWWGADRSS